MFRAKYKHTNQVHSFLIVNLALGDFLMGSYLLVIAVVDWYYRGVYFIHDSDWRQSSMCNVAGFISTFSSELSVFTLTGKRSIIIKYNNIHIHYIIVYQWGIWGRGQWEWTLSPMTWWIIGFYIGVIIRYDDVLRKNEFFLFGTMYVVSYYNSWQEFLIIFFPWHFVRAADGRLLRSSKILSHKQSHTSISA